MKTNDRPFEGILGNTVELRILERLIASPDAEFNVAELSSMTGVHRDSASKVINKFVGWNVLVRTTKGKMDFYRLNSDEPLVVSINAFNDSLIMQMFPEVRAAMESVEDRSAISPPQEGSHTQHRTAIETASKRIAEKYARTLKRPAEP
ncbi:MAG TPA: hypothetical protein PKO24_04335 [Methanomassiliicoccales archaeon]|jgi:hypothetical protein|nr:hypothetical protein [Euryarchaeota archaeon]HOE52842.1 hypothetical protein [Methanomassiliicoccales archaeon]HOO03752.1 hypothetical protein [Methanomassiliicoccales archaeon]HQN76410.1 hypothetical protein [Methanomassiliicoccales archaeon]HRR66319.1 hypothetical protein [Methanomassiliicoccales archaeon]